MNPNQRTLYASNALRVQKQIEKIFLPKVYKALKTQISSFTSEARKYGTAYALSRLPVMDENIASIIQSIHVKAGLFAARETRKLIQRETAGAAKGLSLGTNAPLQLKRSGFGFNERMTADILEYFRMHLLEKAVLPISATTRARIETVLNRGVTEGWSVDRILLELQGNEFLDMTVRRARTIVRTETVRAMNYAGLAAANDSEFEQEKYWIAIKDKRTRRTHKHGTGVDGEKRDILKPFSNGLMFPGDPNGEAKETISCRCTLAFRSKRDEKGRLIPKKREPGRIVSLASQLVNIYRRIASVLSSL